MNYANIKYNDIANGLGVRTGLFVSGCRHACKGCFNESAWDFNCGKKFTNEVANEILDSIEPYYISGLSLLGGEPLDPKNQEEVAKLILKFRKRFGESKDIWCYTGYIYKEDFIKGGRAYTEYTESILDNIDVLVDGPFVAELLNISLKFRGSSNQRLLDMRACRKTGEIKVMDV